MKLLKNEKVIDIMQKTLNHVDSRLIDHGTRVAYLMFKMLGTQNKYDNRQLRDICVLAMLHDIGAYKTEEIDQMVVFETVDIWEHSVYGYLFLKYFSPLRELSPAILFHHADCRDLPRLNPLYRELAQMISLCDRTDMYLLSLNDTKNDMNSFYNFIEKNRDIKFDSDIVDMFLSAKINLEKISDEIKADKDFISILHDTPISHEEADGYLKMTIFSIDFRSSQTVNHTIATTCISRILAGLFGYSENEIEKIVTGAMLHDLGKTGIPIGILESPGRLSADEMEIMKTHVEMTEEIITGCVDDEIKEIAVQHHEKLNGGGYPRKLNASAISFYDRILIIADIFSALCGVRSYKDVYPKEKTIGILSDMSAQGLIDSEIVSLSIKNFDYIIDELNRESHPVIEAYEKLNSEYSRIKESVKKLHFEDIAGVDN